MKEALKKHFNYLSYLDSRPYQDKYNNDKEWYPDKEDYLEQNIVPVRTEGLFLYTGTIPSIPNIR